jgi:hypothetical protein
MGSVAKDNASPYVGGRSLRWLKVKQLEYRLEERAGTKGPGALGRLDQGI